jgi:hypothetical protein
VANWLARAKLEILKLRDRGTANTDEIGVLAVTAVPHRDKSEFSDLSEGTIKAVRSQRTEWHDLTVDGSTTGILICSSILNADIWLALREDFEPDPDLPNLAVFYASEIPLLRDKSEAALRKIHESRLIFNGGKIVPPEEMQ